MNSISKTKNLAHTSKYASNPTNKNTHYNRGFNTINRYNKKNDNTHKEDSQVVQEQYAINNKNKQIKSLSKSRSFSDKKNPYKIIYDKFKNKIEIQAQQISKELSQKRSSSPKISLKSSRSFSRKNKSNRQHTVQTIRKRPIMDCISAEKYIKLNLQKLQTKNKQQYEQKIRQLKEQLQNYKLKYQNSLKALNKMNKYINNQKDKYENSKQVYEQKIRILRAQLDCKNSNNNYIPHLFSYKQYNENSMLPESVILQNTNGQNKSSEFTQKKSESHQLSHIENIMEQFVNKTSSKHSSSGLKSNLSLQSK